MATNSFYGDDIKQAIHLLPEEDKIDLFESIFNALIRTSILYYKTIGHTDIQIREITKREVESVKNLLFTRLNELNIDLNDPIVDENDPIVDENQYKGQATSVEFENDMLIDLHFMMRDVAKPL